MEAARHGDQQLVSDLVAKAVIDQLEVVDVGVEDCRRAVVALCDRECMPDPVQHQGPVRQPRERIVEGLVGQLFLGVAPVVIGSALLAQIRGADVKQMPVLRRDV